MNYTVLCLVFDFNLLLSIGVIGAQFNYAINGDLIYINNFFMKPLEKS